MVLVSKIVKHFLIDARCHQEQIFKLAIAMLDTILMTICKCAQEGEHHDLGIGFPQELTLFKTAVRSPPAGSSELKEWMF
jgi:hypothetical protein